MGLSRRLVLSFVFSSPAHGDKNAQRLRVAATKAKSGRSNPWLRAIARVVFLVLVGLPSLSKKLIAILAAQILYGIVCQFNIVMLRDAL